MHTVFFFVVFSHSFTISRKKRGGPCMLRIVCTYVRSLTIDTIKSLGRLLGQRLGADSTTHLFQRLAICLWKGNAVLRLIKGLATRDYKASMWIRHTPTRPDGWGCIKTTLNCDQFLLLWAKASSLAQPIIFRS